MAQKRVATRFAKPRANKEPAKQQPECLAGLKWLRPSKGTVSLRFICLKQRATLPLQGQEAAEWWIADETASGSLVVATSISKHLAPGEIYQISKGDACRDSSQSLRIFIGKRARLERVGFFTLAFSDTPDVSEPLWVPLAPPAVRTAAPKKQSRQPQAVPKVNDEDKKEEVGNVVPEKQLSCFLCEGPHSVDKCPERARGIAMSVPPKLVDIDGIKRQELVRLALAEARLPLPVHGRYYRKDEIAPVFYMLFDNEMAAHTVKTTPWTVGDDAAKCFPLLSSEERALAKSKTKGKGKDKGKDKGKGKGKKKPTLPDGNEGVQEEPRAHSGTKRDLPDDAEPCSKRQKLTCFLCESTEHLASSCPEIIRSVSVVGLPGVDATGPTEEQLSKLWDVLAKHSVQVESHCWRGPRDVSALGKLYLRLASVRQARKISGVAQGGELRYDGATLRVYTMKGDGSTSAQQGNTEDARDEKDPEQVCVICGSQEHAQQDCPERDCCVQTTGLDRSEEIEEKLRQVAKAHKIEILKMWWKSRVCQMRLQSQDVVAKMISSAMEGSLEITVTKDGQAQQRKLKVYPLRRYPAVVDGQVKPHVAKQPRESSEMDSAWTNPRAMKFAPRNARKSCFLCGDDSHEVPSCPVRDECVLVARNWGAPHGSASLYATLNERLCATLRSAGLTVQRSHWHKSVCYLRLGSSDEAKQLISAATIKGLTIEGEVLRVRAARSTSTKAQKERLLEDAAEVKSSSWEDASGCPLCGTDDHSLATCHALDRGIVVHSSALTATSDAAGLLQEFRDALTEWGIAETVQVRLHNSVIFATLADEAGVQTVLEIAIGEGFELGGELASVQKTRSVLSSAAVAASELDEEEEALNLMRNKLRPRGKLRL